MLTFGAAVVVDEDLPRHTLRDLEVVVGFFAETVELAEKAELQAEHDEEVLEHAADVELAFDCHQG